MTKKNLAQAKRAKNDEFYTRLQDIEAELSHYRPHFAGKTVFLNCDDPTWSAFWRHLHKLFAVYGLKKLIATHYEYDGNVRSYAMVYEGGDDNDVSAGERIELEGNGDFRSDECIEFLKESDIVVTNPPFSLFREYVAQLVEYDKKFLIIGNVNAVTYKEIFPLIKDDRIWAGFSFNKTVEFIMPDSYELRGKAYVDADGKKHGFVPGVCWYTNLDIKKRHEDLFLSATYYKKDGSVPQASLERWPHYDNYDAIEVGKTKDIPVDYAGVMGVPITFLDKYNPEQFEILGFWNTGHAGDVIGATQCEAVSAGKTIVWNGPTVNGKTKYFRILIRARHPHPAGVPVTFDEYDE